MFATRGFGDILAMAARAFVPGQIAKVLWNDLETRHDAPADGASNGPITGIHSS